MKKASSRISNLKLGDANTKFFHQKINGRRRKNYIQRLQKDNGWAFNHEEKASAIQDHFKKVMVIPDPRQQAMV
jgi:hypothetical protein